MTHTNVVTMKVTTPVYTMFIVLSFVVCPSDCGVAVNQKYLSYYSTKQTIRIGLQRVFVKIVSEDFASYFKWIVRSEDNKPNKDTFYIKSVESCTEVIV